MAKKKKKKSWLKKVGKAAALAAAAYGASKMFGGRKGNVSATAANEGIGWTPGPQIPDIHNYTPKTYSPISDHRIGPITQSAKGGRIGAKKGGRVKSMGIAKRGGGAAKR